MYELTLPIVVSVKYPIEFQSLESLVWVNYLQESTRTMYIGFLFGFSLLVYFLASFAQNTGIRHNKGLILYKDEFWAIKGKPQVVKFDLKGHCNIMPKTQRLMWEGNKKFAFPLALP